MKCNHDCLNCQYEDCILDDDDEEFTAEELTYEDIVENELVPRSKKMARARSLKYAENHREQIREYGRKYYHEHREVMSENSVKWCRENRLLVNARKRNRWSENPELYRQKQQDYRSKIKANLPHCDDCEECVLVAKEKQDGYRRVCCVDMRLIEQKVSNSPQWCYKRKKGESNADIKK